jgi:hypothetical protein
VAVVVVLAVTPVMAAQAVTQTPEAVALPGLQVLAEEAEEAALGVPVMLRALFQLLLMV